MATGKYVIVLSGDDLICDENRFAKQFKALENDEKCVATICGFKRFWNDGREEHYPNSHGTQFSRTLFWSGHYVHISAFMFRREVFESPYMLDHFCDDTGLIYSLACMGRWTYNNEVMFGYRQTNLGIMGLADKFERAILEILIFDDCRKIGKFRLSSLARFSKPLSVCYKNRNLILSGCYGKYLDAVNRKSNSYLYSVLNCDAFSFSKRMEIRFLVLLSTAAYLVFKILRKMRKSIFSGC